MRDARPSSVAAIVIAGGQGTRMGGIDKPGLTLGGATLRARAVAAAKAAGLDPVIHVGPEAGDGPLAALVAGIVELAAEEAVVLAGDLVRPDLVIAALASAEASSADGTVLVDPDGQPQWLAARYRVAALRTVIAALPDGPSGMSFRAVASELDLARVRVDAAVVADIDTWQDYENAKEQFDG